MIETTHSILESWWQELEIYGIKSKTNRGLKLPNQWVYNLAHRVGSLTLKYSDCSWLRRRHRSKRRQESSLSLLEWLVLTCSPTRRCSQLLFWALLHLRICHLETPYVLQWAICCPGLILYLVRPLHRPLLNLYNLLRDFSWL